MLGLGLALSIAKKTLGDAIDGLLSTLRGRATYYENGSASKSTIKAIDNADILDKATILLTPTATSNARVHSVKTYTGDELVTNGDFANWTGDNPDNYLVLNEDANNYVTESNGKLRMVSDDSATIAIRPQPTTMLSNDSTYRISVDLTFTTGTLNISGVEFNTSGTKVFYLTPSSTYLQLAKGSALDVLIDNLSIVDVSSDFDFDRASSATRINSDGLVQDMQSITDPELVTNGTFDTDSDWVLGTGWNIADGHLNFDTDDGENNAQQQGLLTVGRIYKMTFDANVTTGTIRFESGTGSNLLITSSDTTVEHIFEADLTALVFRRNVTPTRGYIDNISVKDITFSEDVDLARINYDSNGANGHILLEPTSTNLLTYSEDFSQSTWNKTRCTITANQAISPDGTLNADLMTATDNDARLEDVVASSGIIVTQSIYVKSATGGNVSGQIDFAGADAVTFTANNEWQRVETTLSNTSISPRLRVRITNNADSLFVWGGQVEQLSYATSYIPTLTGSTVTRATETLTGSGNSTLINSTEGVLYAEIAALADDISGFRVLGISDGGSTNRIFIGYTSNNIYANVGAGTTIGSPYTPTNASNFHKVALKYENNNCKFFVDGSQIGSTTTSITIPSGMNSLQFDSGAGGSDFYGKCKALAVFNEALSDTELQNLTS